MGAYDFNFDLPAGETFAPSAERVRALAALLPVGNFGFAPPVTDRAAWSRWRDDPFGQQVLKAARDLAATPYPDYSDAAFVDCLEREDVTHINRVMPVVRRRQVAFFLAEAIFDQGEFLGLIESDTRRLASLRTWIHPGNDLKRLNFDLRTVEPDLGVVHFAANLAQIDHVLGPRLSPGLRELIRTETSRRVFAPTRERLESGRDLYWWMTVKHNWNSVCLACIAEAAAALLSAPDRAWWLAWAESLVRSFRDGFADDGLCSEGVGYWSYGFSHYVMLGELLRMGTGGAIDLLDEPKMRRVARFPDRVEIQPGVFPAYADCGLDVKPAGWARLWLENRIGDPGAATEPVPAGTDPFAGMGLQFTSESCLWMFRTREPRAPRRLALAPGLRQWFDTSSLLVCRPAAATSRRFAATLLGGDNGVNHNHNDIGTFTVVLDGRTLVADPGAETYSFRTFSTHRYDSQLLNSYGHPVPRVAGQLQEAGAEYRARVVEKEFTDDVDRMVLELRNAYDVPALRSLRREFTYDRRGAGSLTITDRVEFSEPAAFESALITFGEVALDGARVRLADSVAAVVAEVTVEGAGLALSVATINQPPSPKRVALACDRPVRRATISVRIRPA